ncbi:MAG TPA: aminotransferase class III-fold pyridoxal phosphate-dependent enzyme, partial [Thermomicrobiales bacterium]|nr:aminotransferase class III-fold pyridoxal phosphate-dependent enzyme [Thermomicrobiales bacterium]
IDIIEAEALPDNAREQGAYLIGRLEELLGHQNVGNVRGKGLMMFVEVVQNKETKQPFDAASGVGARLTAATRERGIIIRAADTGIAISPPLVLTKDEADRVANAIQDSIVEVFG